MSFSETTELDVYDHYDPDIPSRPAPTPSPADRVFRGLALGAASLSFIIIVLLFIFLLLKSRKALDSSGVWKFFTASTWSPATGHFGILGLLVGTMLIAVIALMYAVPLSLGMALFINEYAPAQLRAVLTGVIDLLAALPSLLFGMWGFFALQHKLPLLARFFADHLGFLPIFRINGGSPRLAQSIFTAGTVVAIMIVPIITSVSRDVMAQCPRDQCEAALALGGSRWGMIRAVILPYGRSGIIGAIMLGFGRAMGETIAVALLLEIYFPLKFRVLTNGGGSIAAVIADRLNDAGSLEKSALVGAGLALFLVTFAVNLAARAIVSRASK